MQAAADLAGAHGALSVTMSQIAEKAGIGRATLYKYFGDVEAIFVAWAQSHATAHLRQLQELSDGDAPVRVRLQQVLERYAVLRYERQGTDVAALVHRNHHLGAAEKHLQQLVQSLLEEGRATGAVRDDLPTAELAAYCLHALGAAAQSKSKRAAAKLADVVLTGLVVPPD